MKKRYRVLILIVIAAGSFLAGSWATYQGGRGKATAERKILHYVDPMNPAFKADKPGIAPCGMPLEPVYADQGDASGGADLRASMPPGTIRISPEKQQLIGVKTAIVEKASWSHTLRVLGRVTPDETRTYRVNAAVNGWIEEASTVTTGSLVKENDILATFYSLEYRSLVQNYFNLINVGKEGSPGEKALTQTSRYSTGQLKQLREVASAIGSSTEFSQIDYYRKGLYNFGMSPYQVAEMERTRKIPDSVEIRAPIAGFILYRNVSPGLRFDRGAEFFRIADLSRVWILADIFETEASYFKPGMRVKMELPYQKRTLFAEVSPVLPQFDPATRTLKVRLTADNPGYVMRPDMFVNVEFPVSGAPAIIVSVEAVLDSGLKKTVFVDKGNGFFEPRQVETGRTLGERVEITQGLMPGEKIVVSGNFLIDSEARMQQAASGIFGKIGRDPVCGMNIDEDRSNKDGNVRQYKGKGYFFCSPECRDEFGKDPERYLKSAPAQQAMPIAGSQDADAKRVSTGMQKTPSASGGKIGRDPVCGMDIDEGRARAEGNFLEFKGRTYFFCDANDRELFRKDPERYLKSAPMQGAMPMAGSQDADAKHLSHPPAAVSKQTGAKTASEAHDGMSMPMGQTPAAMSGMPAASPKTGSNAKGMGVPSATDPGMSPKPSASPGQGGMAMPQGAAPMPAPQSGGMTQPSPSPGMGSPMPAVPRPGQRPAPGPSSAAPLSGPKAGEMISPSSLESGADRPAPSSPGPGKMAVPGPGDAVLFPGGKPGEVFRPVVGDPSMSQGAPASPAPGNAPGPMPQEAAPAPVRQPGAIAPPEPPVTRTPRINPRLQRSRPTIAAPREGVPGAAPMPGSTADQPATGSPEVKP